MSLLAQPCVALSCFASLDALMPRVMQLCLASSPAVAKPGTAIGATAEFAGFLDGTTFDTRGTDCRRDV